MTPEQISDNVKRVRSAFVESVWELGDLLDTLNMHAHNDVIPHWLCIPAGEWNQSIIDESLAKVAALKEKA